jgi:hypothetical protein
VSGPRAPHRGALRAQAAALIWALAALLCASCQTVIGVNAPCDVDADCGAALVCDGAFCVAAPAEGEGEEGEGEEGEGEGVEGEGEEGEGEGEEGEGEGEEGEGEGGIGGNPDEDPGINLTPDDEPPPDEIVDSTGCGCTSRSSSSLLELALVMAALVFARRQWSSARSPR